MRSPEECTTRDGVLTRAYGVVVPVYVVAGAVGFWAFGNATTGNVVENLSSGWLRTATLALTLPMYVMGILEENQLVATKAEQSLGVHPTAWLAPAWSRASLPPGLVRLLVRSAIVFAEVAGAEMLFSAGVGNIQSLVGSISGLSLAFWMPVLLHFKVRWRAAVGLL